MLIASLDEHDQEGSVATQTYKVILEWDSEAQAWVTYVPALNLLSTFGETRDEAINNSREAIVGYIEAATKEGLPIPTSGAETELVDIEVAVA